MACQPLRHLPLPLLLLALVLCAAPARADEWNDSFATPQPYRVLRGIAVRAGPGNSHERLGSVNADDVLKVHEIVNGWHRFEYGGRQGWIFKRYLRPMAAGELEATSSRSPAPETPPETPPADEDANAVAKALAELEDSVEPAVPPEEAAAPPEEDAAPLEEDSAPAAEEAPQQTTGTAATALDEAAPRPEALDKPVDADKPLRLEREPEADASLAGQTVETGETAPRKPLRPLSADELADCERFISLQPGQQSGKATFQGSLPPGEKACFRILALEGWTLEILVDSENDSARFDVFTPTEGRLAGAMKAWAHPVQQSGDKQIVVRGGEAPTRYELDIQVR